MASNSSFIEELVKAGRGVVALIVGDRKAPQYFDFSQRGLYGSFIAVLLVMAFETVLPMLMGMSGPGGSIFRAVAMVAILFGFSIAAAALVLRQLKRLDGLVPYVTVVNWANFFVGVATSALVIFGFPGDIVLIVGVIVGLVIQINIARLIVTLSPLQIAMFLVAQFVGVLVGLLLVGMLLPLSPDELAAIAAASNPPA